MPSLSVSTDSVGSNGNASLTSNTPSLSSSVSALLPMPSLSVSTDSVGSNGNASLTSNTPSLSSSVSTSLGIPSPSVSIPVLQGLGLFIVVAGNAASKASSCVQDSWLLSLRLSVCSCVSPNSELTSVSWLFLTFNFSTWIRSLALKVVSWLFFARSSIKFVKPLTLSDVSWLSRTRRSTRLANPDTFNDVSWFSCSRSVTRLLRLETFSEVSRLLRTRRSCNPVKPVTFKTLNWLFCSRNLTRFGAFGSVMPMSWLFFTLRICSWVNVLTSNVVIWLSRNLKFFRFVNASIPLASTISMLLQFNDVTSLLSTQSLSSAFSSTHSLRFWSAKLRLEIGVAPALGTLKSKSPPKKAVNKFELMWGWFFITNAWQIIVMVFMVQSPLSSQVIVLEHRS